MIFYIKYDDNSQLLMLASLTTNCSTSSDINLCGSKLELVSPIVKLNR